MPVLPSNIRKHPRATLEAAATLTLAGTGACPGDTRDTARAGWL